MKRKSKTTGNKEKVPEDAKRVAAVKVDKSKIVSQYDFEYDGVPAKVTISWEPNEYVQIYKIDVPETFR